MATPPARESPIGPKVFKKKKKRTRQYDDPVAVAAPLEHHQPARGGSTPPESSPPSPSSFPGKPQQETTVVERRQDTAINRKGESGRPVVQIPPTESLTMEELFEGTFTEEALRSAAGTQPLRDVTKLALVIDSSLTSIEGVWAAVPRLHTLTLDGSRLSSFRDLGVGLRALNTLSLESSCVEDLDGIGALSGLRKLHLTRNRVSDVTPLACHSSLQVLGLESNRVSYMNALEILGSLPLLYSLDLRQNPLMDSLGKLIDGRGRGVVHQLIPQLRILDGSQFSGGEGDLAVDAQLLDEADDLICEGASRARAAWAEEDAAEEMDAANQWEREAAGERSPGSPSASSRRRRRREGVVAAAAGVDGGGSQQQAEDRGMVHWDSDLTQGGRQALSGNPSSAIRRHKLGKDAGKRRSSHSPARVLDTLDLARLTEQGLKHRHNQAADRVSEWRRETCSDSKPQDHVPAPVSAALSRKTLTPVGPPPPSEPHSPGAAPRSSLDGGPCDRRGGTTERSGRRDRQAGSASRWGSGSGMTSPPMLASMSVSAVDVEDARSSISAVGRPGHSGRPWTTGGCGGGRDTPPGANSTKKSTSEMSPSTPLKAQEVGKDVLGGGGGHGRSRRQRPQTATELSGKRCGGPEEPARSNSNNSTSWQPVWESLKTARLVSPAVSKEAVGKEGGTSTSSTQAVAHDDGFVRLRNVNFRCQRRARTARTRTRSAGGRDGCLGERDNSLSAEEPGGSDESDEASFRNEVKRRASRFETASGVASATSDVAGCTPAEFTLPQGLPPTPEASAGNGGSEDQPCRVSAQNQKACADGKHLPPKARRKETANTTAPSRRSLSAMDSSSSEDETCVTRKPKPPRNTLSSDRCGVDDSSGYGGAGGGASNNGGASSSGDGSGSPTGRVSSAHASRALGFDLRKSLAAIDEWTDKATTATARDDSCSGASGQGGATPLTTTTNTNPPVPCFVQRPERPTSSTPRTGSGREVAKGFRHATDARSMVGGAASKGFAQTQTVVLGAITVDDDSSSEEDDGSEGEGVISVAAARAALGISKVCTTTTTALAGSSSSGGRTPRPSWISSAAARAPARRPSPGDIDGLLAEGGHASTMPGGGKPAGSANSNRRGGGKRVSSTPASPGLAVGMSDEELRCMLRRQPRTVPELRTKDSFRQFFQGMGEERMGRLLRGAYEGSLPADEVDRKVDKRLGLVGDLLTRQSAGRN